MKQDKSGLFYQLYNLNAGRVEHDFDLLGDGSAREVAGEFSTNDAAVAVRTGNLAPDDPKNKTGHDKKGSIKYFFLISVFLEF